MRSGSRLFVGGSFGRINGETRARLAELDLATAAVAPFAPAVEQPDDSGGLGVYDMALSGTTLYLVGAFGAVDEVERSNAAAIDTTTGEVSAFAPNPSGGAFGGLETIAVDDGVAFLGGDFSRAGGELRTGLAAVDATTGQATLWDAGADGGESGFVQVADLTVDGDVIWVAGSFSSIGGEERRGIAAVSTTTAEAGAFDAGLDGRATVVRPHGGVVYVGGDFTMAGGVTRHNAAALRSDGTPTGFDPRPNRPLSDLAVQDGEVTAGGAFELAGRPLATVPHLARLEGDGSLDTDWRPAPDGRIQALARVGSTLYLGGAFIRVGGVVRPAAAAVDTATGALKPFDARVGIFPEFGPPSVGALVATDSTVYLGGTFFGAGGKSRFGLAAVDAATGDATAFEAPASSASDGGAMALVGSTLFYTGLGQSSEDIPAYDAETGAAKAFPSAQNGPIWQLLADGNSLYVIGGFSEIGGQPRGGIAALDAATAAALPFAPEVPAAIGVMALAGNRLYLSTRGFGAAAPLYAADTATGALTPVEGRIPACCVNALAADGTSVYLGGAFWQVGDDITGPYTQFEVGTGSPTPTPTPSATAVPSATATATATAAASPTATATASPTAPASPASPAPSPAAAVGPVIVPPSMTVPPTAGPTTTARCEPPRLKGMRPKAAKRAIRRAGCRVGEITRPERRRKGRRLVVAKQARDGRVIDLRFKYRRDRRRERQQRRDRRQD